MAFENVKLKMNENSKKNQFGVEIFIGKCQTLETSYEKIRNSRKFPILAIFITLLQFPNHFELSLPPNRQEPRGKNLTQSENKLLMNQKHVEDSYKLQTHMIKALSENYLGVLAQERESLRPGHQMVLQRLEPPGFGKLHSCLMLFFVEPSSLRVYKEL